MLINWDATDQGAFDVRHVPTAGAKPDIAEVRVGATSAAHASQQIATLVSSTPDNDR